MAKKIAFISPIDYLSGNLSGKQDLKYALNDNPAYDAPEGKQYARNYKPRFIGTHRAADGTNSFQVRSKTATNIKPGTKLVMASLGAAASLSEVIMGKLSTWTTLKTIILASFDAGFKSGEITEKSAKTWLTAQLRDMYASKSQSIQLPNYSQSGTVISPIYNQFIAQQWDPERDPSLDARILVKFWTALSIDGITFKVNSKKGIGWLDNGFDSIVGSAINVLNVKIQASTGYVLTSLDEYLIHSDGSYVIDADVISPNEVFGTTTTAPQP